MKLVVWGLGFVGSVVAAEFANRGHNVVGVDTNAAKVDAINAGTSPVMEPGLAELIERQVEAGRLLATADEAKAMRDADVSLICVGTPTGPDGTPDLSHIGSVAAGIGRNLALAGDHHTVVLRSTVPPGTARGRLQTILRQTSGRQDGDGIGIAMNPEFLREATAIEDFRDPELTVIGAIDDRSFNVVKALYATIDAPVLRMSLEEAELMKLATNAFHALKVGFANEIGRLCDRLDLDSHAVMNGLIADRRLNISSAYLRPGFAYGGSCLPKDLRNLSHQLRLQGVRAPILDGVMASNHQQIEEAMRKVSDNGVRRVTVLGLAFKAGTDDLRESPLVSLVDALWRDGYDVSVFDPDVRLDRMVGSNREFVARQLPQIAEVLRPTLEDALADTELVIVGQRRKEFTEAVSRLSGIRVLDLVRISDDPAPTMSAEYAGLSW